MSTPEWFTTAVRARPEVRWSVCMLARDGRLLLRHDEHAVLRTASVGKVLLEVLRQVDLGLLDLSRPVARPDPPWVADSGLWQHLAVDRLTVEDLRRLVGAVSDNLATNALLDLVGLPWPSGLCTELGLVGTALHDRVRDARGPEHPPTLSTGTAAELSSLMHGLALGREISGPASRQALGWLALNTDLSLVASAFGLDPLAHTGPDLGLRLANKTGTDAGIRAEVGTLTGPAGQVGYAVLANWPPDLQAGAERATRHAVLATMRRLGEHLLDRVVTRSAGSPGPG